MKPGSKRLADTYSALIERIFLDRYTPGASEVLFQREYLTKAAKALGIALPIFRCPACG